MVTVISHEQRFNAEGEAFHALIVQGGVMMVQSQDTGKYYATAKKASVPSTFDEQTCEGLIGTQIEGSVVKVGCEPYDYTIPDTGEAITLSHRWEYRPPENQEQEMVDEVFEQKKPEPAMANASE